MIQFFEDRGVHVAITSDGKLTLKGLSNLDSDARQKVLTFARDHKAAILSELHPPPPKQGQILPENTKAYWNSLIRCPVGTPSQARAIEPALTSQGTKTCPACGKSQWWRLDKPDSKWICGRCHPPATGLDVIYE